MKTKSLTLREHKTQNNYIVSFELSTKINTVDEYN